MNKNNAFNSIINSNEYKIKLSEHLTFLLRRTKAAETESSIAFSFESEIYFLARTLFDIDINFKKEENQSTLRHKFIGRIDAICNNLVIEYKKPKKLRSEADKTFAVNQLSTYLTQLVKEGNSEFQGILTDGIKLKYFYFQEGTIYSTPFKNIDESDLDKIIQYLTDVNNKKFVTENVVNDFRLDSKTNITSRLAKYLFTKLTTDFSGKTAMLYQEWEVLFHLSENDKGQNEDIKKRRKALSKLFNVEIKDSSTDYRALFSLQTTYAIIVKLIACKVVTKIEFNKEIEYFSDLSKLESLTLRKFLEYIEDGYVFQTGGIRNLLEGDFFSWYCSVNTWSEKEASLIIEIINILEGYSNTFYKHGYSTIDIFKELYMEIMPHEVRHSLGEYFTPTWLADYVIKESVKLIKNKNFVIIDPCCGSGIFLMLAIKQIMGSNDIISLPDKSKRELLLSILNRVKGVDINPLSVLTAKVCFYLSIKPLLSEGENIEIPIYLGDSANIPIRKKIDGIDCYQYTISTKQENINVLLPAIFVESINFLTMMSQIQAIIKTGDENLVHQKFIQNIGEKNINHKIKTNITLLSKQLITLHKKNWDGIWIRIVANFMLVARIKNIDLIVGNPPWVKWEYLPQAYAEKIKSLCIEKHLFSGQTYMGAISLNICALIANVTASTWLTNNGILAFLMPQTLMTQDSYAGFRNFYINVKENKRMYLQKMDDWTKSGNPFVENAEKFMTYYYGHNHVNYMNDGIPITAIKKRAGVSILEINSKNSYSEVKDKFDIYYKKAFQLDKDRTGLTTIESSSIDKKKFYDIIIGNCDYKARSGVEFTPAEVYFVEPLSKISKIDSYLFKNSKFNNSKYKSVTNLPIQLETKFIKPVIKAPEIIPFGIKKNSNYCIFPYEDGKSISIGEVKLLQESPQLFNYLTNNKNLIEKQSKRSLSISRGNAFYSLSKVGNYTFSPYKVVFRDNTKLSAFVLKEESTPWGKKVMPICAKHCPYISQDKKGRNINEDEAYYLCGILNTPIIREYFKSTYSTRSYSINFNIKMPLYNQKNIHQRKISQLSKEASYKGATENILRDIESSYLELCKELS